MKGDSIEWASINYNDEHWQNRYEEISTDELFWVRHDYSFREADENRSGLGLLITAIGSYELYWDGVYLGKNGALKENGKPEVEGAYQAFFTLPDTLVKSKDHVLAMRTSKASDLTGQHSYIIIDKFIKLTRGPLQVSKYMFMIGGIFLITAFYFFFLFANQPKEYSVLIFAIICIVFLSLLMFEYLKLFYDYSYSFQRPRLQIIEYLHIIISLLMPLFLMIHFSFPWKKWMLGVLVFCLVFIIKFWPKLSFDDVAVKLIILTWVFSTAIVTYALFKKQKGAAIVFSSLMISLFMSRFIYFFDIAFVSSFDVYLFISFTLIAITMIYVMIQKRREERKAYERSLITSERLKNELLKKNIKPHFIMNTLTSLIDWVEESPKEGVKFIHALANEFEVLNEIADYQLVPVEQEIKLCKRHLEVMGFRKEITYHWEDEGIDPNDTIPPAIIHTAVENGVSHSLPNTDGSISFKLQFERTEKYKQYTLSTKAEIRKSSTFDEMDNENGDGMGLKYIKARLQESYHDRWTLTSESTSDGWATIIRIAE
ncbi:MAG: histidine kinase [Bacteroidota bacterium]